jgi:uncharacterized protein
VAFSFATILGMHPAHILILPGWQNSGPAHWQSLWEAELGAERVVQHDWMHPLRGDWITRLEDHVLSIHEHSAQQIQGPNAKNALKMRSPTGSADILLVAHSLGCHLVAAWAGLSKNTHRIRGALLVAPPDGVRAQFPPELKSWRPPVLARLPFPSICVVSSNDPFCDLEPGIAMAAAWGSRCEQIGERGHINADSGLNDWPQGKAWLAELAALP